MANGLMSLGLSRDDKVAILSTTRLEWCLADIAGILGGFVTVPVYPSNLPDQVEYVLANSKSSVVFVEDEMQWNKVAGIRKNLPSLATVVMFSGDLQGKEGTIGLSDLRARGAQYEAANPGALSRRTEEIRPEDDLTIIYTSGTTGPPKGVVTRHGNYVFIITSTLEAVIVGKSETFLQFLPLAHSLGRLEHFLTFDAMAVSAFARDIQTVGEDLALVRPEIMVSVPRLYEKFYARVLAKVEEDGGLKKAIFHWAIGVGREVSRHIQRKEAVSGFLSVRFSLAEKLVFRKIRERMGGRFRFAISGGAPLSPTTTTNSERWGRRCREPRSGSPPTGRSSSGALTCSRSTSVIRRLPGKRSTQTGGCKPGTSGNSTPRDSCESRTGRRTSS
jgi:long-chain acyl-CoA synthetase